MWDLIVSVPDHWLSFYFTLNVKFPFWFSIHNDILPLYSFYCKVYISYFLVQFQYVFPFLSIIRVMTGIIWLMLFCVFDYVCYLNMEIIQDSDLILCTETLTLTLLVLFLIR